LPPGGCSDGDAGGSVLLDVDGGSVVVDGVVVDDSVGVVDGVVVEVEPPPPWERWTML
jgi:hypothetical protein